MYKNAKTQRMQKVQKYKKLSGASYQYKKAILSKTEKVQKLKGTPKCNKMEMQKCKIHKKYKNKKKLSGATQCRIILISPVKCNVCDPFN